MSYLLSLRRETWLACVGGCVHECFILTTSTQSVIRNKLPAQLLVRDRHCRLSGKAHASCTQLSFRELETRVGLSRALCWGSLEAAPQRPVGARLSGLERAE